MQWPNILPAPARPSGFAYWAMQPDLCGRRRGLLTSAAGVVAMVDVVVTARGAGTDAGAFRNARWPVSRSHPGDATRRLSSFRISPPCGHIGYTVRTRAPPRTALEGQRPATSEHEAAPPRQRAARVRAFPLNAEKGGRCKEQLLMAFPSLPKRPPGSKGSTRSPAAGCRPGGPRWSAAAPVAARRCWQWSSWCAARRSSTSRACS